MIGSPIEEMQDSGFSALAEDGRFFFCHLPGERLGIRAKKSLTEEVLVEEVSKPLPVFLHGFRVGFLHDCHEVVAKFEAWLALE